MRLPGVMGEAVHALADQAAAFEALLLIASALHKGLDGSHVLRVVHRFAGVRKSLAPAVLAAVAFSEAAAGGLLFVPALRTPAALAAAVIWSTYLLLIVRAIGQGRRDADCGCSFGASQRPLGAYQVARSTVLIGLAAGVALAGAPATAGPQGSQLLAAFALLALYGALDQVMGLQPLRGGVVS